RIFSVRPATLPASPATTALRILKDDQAPGLRKTIHGGILTGFARRTQPGEANSPIAPCAMARRCRSQK
ncbi:MAG TPA: hypothetical protein PLN02_06125, partial [Azonexus sp.]|nr:hypothetical protein [Azonexus sp.]